MDFDELEKHLEEAWVEYWGLDDSRFHVENSNEFSEEERASILKELEDYMEEVALRIDALQDEKDLMENGN